ncbi:lysosomal Pro-X carboxypeptidase-like, partial [Jatropha curcas]|uniref:lysosomal Pro-X carboxypeptidase-like n=1 Tax=Jatropha curcas TaxID=180498 RepID=UPI001893A99D
MSSKCLFQWFLFFFFFFFILLTSATSKKFNIPRLSPIGPRISLEDPESLSESSLSDDLETYFYNQTLDHFNYNPESYSTFQQRYVINSKYWGGSNSNYAPIFVYFGAEAPLDGDLSIIGFLSDNAIKFKALLVYIEHRFYGKSIPFGSQEEAVKNASVRGYFNSAQALADYAEIILHVKKTFDAENSPVIVIGGSYGGMLASWFRLKYPHIALGALASSAPILYFDDITPQDGYYSLVTKDYKEASESCYQTIQKSWPEIDQLASQPNGLAILSKKFKTC